MARAQRDAAQEARLTVLKRELAKSALARPAAEVLELPWVTTASIVTAPRASATDTRWCPSWTA